MKEYGVSANGYLDDEDIIFKGSFEECTEYADKNYWESGAFIIPLEMLEMYREEIKNNNIKLEMM